MKKNENPRHLGARESKRTIADSVEVRNGYIKAFDGTKLFYSVEGKGKPLVFCYGIFCSSLHWTYQIDYFRRHYQSIWYDYRGHNHSEMPKDVSSLNVANLARDMHTVLDELKIKDAIFLGHSMGVNVILEYYRQHPERFAGMILVNGTGRRPLETLFGGNVTQKLFAIARATYEANPELFRKIWYAKGDNPLTRIIITAGGFNQSLAHKEDIAKYVKLMSKMDPGVLLYLMKEYDLFDATPYLHLVKTPSLILSGEKDLITPSQEGDLLHQLIPGSQYQLIEHGSHCTQLDLPELVNFKIEKFLNEIGYTPAKNAGQSKSEAGKKKGSRSSVRAVPASASGTSVARKKKGKRAEIERQR